MSIEITFKVYYKYLANDSFDENGFETVSLSLNEDEYQRLTTAKESGIDFGDADIAKDIYDKILEINKNNDYDYYVSHPETVANAMNYMLYFIERERIVCSDFEPSEASIKKFVEEIYRKIDYPEL
ncbi:MAG: hypothetical protein PUB87_02570 [Eubacteriaceae bacterium]|nr:hypothetical protein [Eubacteriaceae bacterium]